MIRRLTRKISKVSCRDCECWGDGSAYVNDSSFGVARLCHRFPPTISNVDGGHSYGAGFVLTRQDDFCFSGLSKTSKIMNDCITAAALSVGREEYIEQLQRAIDRISALKGHDEILKRLKEILASEKQLLQKS